jgi:hypothetical protein
LAAFPAWDGELALTVLLVAAPAVAIALTPAPRATQQMATLSSRQCLRMDDMNRDLACRCRVNVPCTVAGH